MAMKPDGTVGEKVIIDALTEVSGDANDSASATEILRVWREGLPRLNQPPVVARVCDLDTDREIRLPGAEPESDSKTLG